MVLIHQIGCYTCYFAKIPVFFWIFAWKDGNQSETDTIPTPKVIIDQDSDPDATVVEVTFGDRLGALLDTVLSNPINLFK